MLTVFYFIGLFFAIPIIYKHIGENTFETFPILLQEQKQWLVFFSCLFSLFSWIAIIYVRLNSRHEQR